MRTENHDIAIIGGGPAGAAYAIYLSGLGIDVCLVEKKKFPREVICGEFLSGEVIESLAEMNLTDNFFSLSPNQIRSVKFIFDDKGTAASTLSFPAYSLRRSTFDYFLLNAAKQNGTNIIQPAEVKEICRDGKIFKMKIKRQEGDEVQISSAILAAAYGKQNVLDKYLERSFTGVRTNYYGVKFHIDKRLFKHFEDSEIRMYSSPGVYCGLNAVDNNMVNLCFLRNRRDNSESSKDFLYNFISRIKSLEELFYPSYEQELKSISKFGTANIYFGKRQKVENGVFMIGDSAGMIAPLSGDGIAMAFQSAKLLAVISMDIINGKIKRNKAEELYSSEWNYLFRKRKFAASIIQKIILNNPYRNAIKYFVKFNDSILPDLIKITRG